MGDDSIVRHCYNARDHDGNARTIRKYERTNDLDMQRCVHSRIRMSCRLGLVNSVAVSSRPVLTRGCGSVHKLQRRIVR